MSRTSATTSVWRFASAVAAAAALLAAGGAEAVSAAAGGLSTSDGQQLQGAADLSAAGQADMYTAPAQHRRALNAVNDRDDLDDIVTAPGRDLLQQVRRTNNRRPNRGRRVDNGRRGTGRRGRRADFFPPTPEGEASCSLEATVEEVEIYDADFIHASASVPLTSCLPPA